MPLTSQSTESNRVVHRNLFAYLPYLPTGEVLSWQAERTCHLSSQITHSSQNPVFVLVRERQLSPFISFERGTTLPNPCSPSLSVSCILSLFLPLNPIFSMTLVESASIQGNGRREKPMLWRSLLEKSCRKIGPGRNTESMSEWVSERERGCHRPQW